MKKRILALSVLLVLVLSSLTGCGRKGSVVVLEEPDQQTVTITFFGYKYEPENVKVIEEILSDFMAENPGVRISYESIKGNTYHEALQKRMASGNGNDVFLANHDGLLKLEQQGMVADLSGLNTISNFTQQMRGQMEQDGTIYWVPTTVSAFGLYCNLDLLKEHNQNVPSTLAEWEAVCNYFVGQDITPIIANNDISLKTLAIGVGFYEVYQEGRQMEVMERLNRGEAALSDYLRSGFELAEEFIQKRYIDGEAALNTEKNSEDLQEFVKGESPFMLTGAWSAGRVEAMEPGFAFEVAPLPVLEDGSLLVINPDTKLSVNADSDHMDAAMKFVEYFTQEENIRKFADQQSSFSPLQGGNPSTVRAVQPLISDYVAGRTVIGTDALLDLPIWDLTAEASKKLLAGEPLNAVMEELDRQAEEDRLR